MWNDWLTTGVSLPWQPAKGRRKREKKREKQYKRKKERKNNIKIQKQSAPANVYINTSRMDKIGRNAKDI